MSNIKISGFLVCLLFLLFFKQNNASAQGINSGFREFGISVSNTLEGDRLAGSAGRATSIALHPSDPTRALACAEAGGLFYTDNGGNSWKEGGTDKLPYSGFGNAQIVIHNGIEYWFASTGGAFDGVMSQTDGVWRSSDRGLNWEHIADFQKIPCIIEGNLNNLISPDYLNRQDEESKREQRKARIFKLYALPSNNSVFFICSTWGLWKTENVFAKNVNWAPIDTDSDGMILGVPYSLEQVVDIEEISVLGVNNLFITTNAKVYSLFAGNTIVGPLVCRSINNGPFSNISDIAIFNGLEESIPSILETNYIYLNIEPILDRQATEPLAFICMQGDIKFSSSRIGYLRLGTLNENLGIEFNSSNFPNTAFENLSDVQYSTRSLFSFSISPFSIEDNSTKKYFITGGNGHFINGMVDLNRNITNNSLVSTTGRQQTTDGFVHVDPNFTIWRKNSTSILDFDVWHACDGSVYKASSIKPTYAAWLNWQPKRVHLNITMPLDFGMSINCPTRVVEGLHENQSWTNFTNSDPNIWNLDNRADGDGGVSSTTNGNCSNISFHTQRSNSPGHLITMLMNGSGSSIIWYPPANTPNSNDNLVKLRASNTCGIYPYVDNMVTLSTPNRNYTYASCMNVQQQLNNNKRIVFPVANTDYCFIPLASTSTNGGQKIQGIARVKIQKDPNSPCGFLQPTVLFTVPYVLGERPNEVIVNAMIPTNNVYDIITVPDRPDLFYTINTFNGGGKIHRVKISLRDENDPSSDPILMDGTDFPVISITEITHNIGNENGYAALFGLSEGIDASEGLYVGTSRGQLFYINKFMNQWVEIGVRGSDNAIPQLKSLPRVAISGLKLYKDPNSNADNIITVGTLGRGLWQTDSWCKDHPESCQGNFVPNASLKITGTDITCLCAPSYLEAGGSKPKLQVSVSGVAPGKTFKVTWHPKPDNEVILNDYTLVSPEIISSSGTHKVSFTVFVIESSGTVVSKDISYTLKDDQEPIIVIRDIEGDIGEAHLQNLGPSLFSSPDIWNSRSSRNTWETLDQTANYRGPILSEIQMPGINYYLSSTSGLQTNTANELARMYVNPVSYLNELDPTVVDPSFIRDRMVLLTRLNRLYTRVWNKGCVKNTKPQYVHLYWTKGSTFEPWKDTWVTDPNANALSERLNFDYNANICIDANQDPNSCVLRTTSVPDRTFGKEASIETFSSSNFVNSPLGQVYMKGHEITGILGAVKLQINSNEILPGSSVVKSHPWFPPRWQNYNTFVSTWEGFNYSRVSTCFLARVTEDNGSGSEVPIGDEGYSGEPIERPVREYARVATRNSWTENLSSSGRSFAATASITSQIVELRTSQSIPDAILHITQTAGSPNFANVIELTLRFPEAQYNEWVSTAQGTEIQKNDLDHSITILGPNATIEGLTTTSPFNVIVVCRLKNLTTPNVASFESFRLDFEDKSNPTLNDDAALNFNYNILANNEPGIFDEKYFLSYDGFNDYCKAKPNIAYDNVNKFTIEAITTLVPKKENQFYTVFTNKVDNDKGITFGIWADKDNNEARLYAEFGKTLYQTDPLDLIDKCRHIALKHDAGKLYFYLDGVEVFQVSNPTGNHQVTGNPIHIGTSFDFEPSKHFRGGIAEVMYWKTYLSDAEILEHYEMNKVTGNETALIGFWAFEEFAGQYSKDHSVTKNDLLIGSTPDWDINDPNWESDECQPFIDDFTNYPPSDDSQPEENNGNQGLQNRDNATPLLSDKVKFGAFPNPTSDMLTLVSYGSISENDPISIKLFTLLGKEIKEVKFVRESGTTFNTSIENLPVGIYQIEVIYKDQKHSLLVTKK